MSQMPDNSKGTFKIVAYAAYTYWNENLYIIGFILKLLYYRFILKPNYRLSKPS